MDALFDCDKSSSSGFRSSQNAFTSADLDLVISGLKFNFRSFGRGKSLGLVFNPSGNALVLSFRNFAFNFLMLRRVADTFLDARSPNSMTYIYTIAISNSVNHLQKWFKHLNSYSLWLYSVSYLWKRTQFIILSMFSMFWRLITYAKVTKRWAWRSIGNRFDTITATFI